MKPPRKKLKAGPPAPRGNPPGKNAPLPAGKPLTPARKWLFRFLALIVIPLVLLGGTEAGLRLAGYGYRTGFFKEIHIGQESFYVNNDTFALRFFPPPLARWPTPFKMAVPKPAGTYRIFILGESAAMGDPEPAFGPGRFLEALLEARYPQTHFEIINLGVTAIDSHVILPIARDCARHAGDLWIVYMGNNEMVGPFGAATVFGAKAPPLWLIRFNLALQKTRLGQLLVAVSRKFKHGGADNPSWGGMEMFVGNQLPANDPRRAVVDENFSQNLHDILQAGLNAGAKILLNTVAVNLKDCAPFASLVNSNLPAADRAQFDQLYQEGCGLEDQQNFAAAAQKFAEAARLDPTVADLQYRWGKSLLALKNFTGAQEHLQLACDDDALPFRTDSRLNDLIKNAAESFASPQLVLFDAAAALATNTPSGLCGDETFFEHVHFDFDGSYRLGRAWAEQVGKLLPADIARNAVTNGWISQAACDRRLGLSDWNRAEVIQHMIGRLEQPPLNGQLDNAQRVKKLENRLQELHPRMTVATAAETKKIFQETLQQAPDDFLLRESYALFLQSTGDVPSATTEWRRIHDSLPQDYVASFQLGRLLSLQGQWEEAEPLLQRSVTLHPYFPEGWFELGNVHASERKFNPALTDYERARQLRPQDWQTVFRTGKVLAELNRHAEAVQHYREAIKLNPGFWEAHYELAGELDAAGQLAEAEQEFGATVRLDSGNSRAHFNHGVLLAKLGHLDEARLEFEETIRLEPGYEKAHEYLRALPSLKRPAP